MSILIHQCLHGYSNGHQLLATSTELTSDVKRLLLFQSDLTGSNIQPGFENYLTGYPVLKSSYYALAKTWYANEISRPGCVWTQTLLIELVDLGKIAELSSLLNLFIRPNGDYKVYESPVPFTNDLSNLGNQRQPEYDTIAGSLYRDYESTILVESEGSEIYAPAIFDIWSDQWPRLRRNFTFCTGTLSLKSLGIKEFDLQVVPIKLSQSIARPSKNSKIINLLKTKHEEWLEIVHKTPKTLLRQFLWSFGADITGERNKFEGLVNLFKQISEDNINLDGINHIIKDTLPSPEDGKTFKQSIFGERRSSGKFSELEILNFLLNEQDVEHLRIGDYNISNRIQKYTIEHPEQINKIIDIFINSHTERIDENIWSNIIIPNDKINEVLSGDSIEVENIITKHPSYTCLTSVWQLNNHIQLKIFKALLNVYPNFLPIDVLNAILKSESEIIFEAEKNYGNTIVYKSLDWLNGDNNILPQWRKRITYDYDSLYSNWITENISNLSFKVIENIFLEHNPKWVFRLSFHYETWLNFYYHFKNTNNGNSLPYISPLFLAKGLINTDKGAQWIIATTFEDVYMLAKRSMLDRHWQLIPKDMDDFDDDDISFNPIETIFKIFGFTGKKKKQVQYWDYCEILIRTISNKYIKNQWSSQAFLDTTKFPEIFHRSIEYLISSKKGRIFLLNIKKDISQSRLRINQNQSEFFSAFEV